MEDTERVLLAELRTVWANVNRARFRGELRPCTLTLARRAAELGRWVRETRTIELSWALVVERPWGEVVAVLEHEMAHQYVNEVEKVVDESAHGPTFRRVCSERGIDARAAGMPEVEDAATPAIVRRIRKLLALAESPVEAEARAAARLAWRLMLRHNVSEAQTREQLGFGTLQLGPARVRIPRHEQLLAGLLGQRFFVDITLVPAFDVGELRWGRAVEASGRSDNLEVAAWVWDYVLETAQRALRAARRDHGIAGAAAGQRFLDGVVLGFRDKLNEEAAVAQQEEGLVWVGDPALDEFVARRHPSRRRGRRIGVRADEAFAHGQAAGRSITLRRPVVDRTSGVRGALPGPRGDG